MIFFNAIFEKKFAKSDFIPIFAPLLKLNAVVAQWQSTSLVRKRSRVQASSTAQRREELFFSPFSFYKSFIISTISHFIIFYTYVIIVRIEYIHFLNSIIILIFTLMKIEQIQSLYNYYCHFLYQGKDDARIAKVDSLDAVKRFIADVEAKQLGLN